MINPNFWAGLDKVHSLRIKQQQSSLLRPLKFTTVCMLRNLQSSFCWSAWGRGWGGGEVAFPLAWETETPPGALSSDFTGFSFLLKNKQTKSSLSVLRWSESRLAEVPAPLLWAPWAMGVPSAPLSCACACACAHAHARTHVHTRTPTCTRVHTCIIRALSL